MAPAGNSQKTTLRPSLLKSDWVSPPCDGGSGMETSMSPASSFGGDEKTSKIGNKWEGYF